MSMLPRCEFRTVATAARCTIVAAILILAPPASAQQECCGGPECCGGFGTPCVLTYGAGGTVRDAVSGTPIAGARVEVPGIGFVESAADGSFDLHGTRPETCHIDYYVAVRISAAGFHTYEVELYGSSAYLYWDFKLDPVEAGRTIAGFVAEFPICQGRMRGIQVELTPTGLVQHTDQNGEFSFSDVPPGRYDLVVRGCNPYGCWLSTFVEVADADVYDAHVCMYEPTLPPVPPATPTPTPTPQSATPARSTPTAEAPTTDAAQSDGGGGCTTAGQPTASSIPALLAGILLLRIASAVSRRKVRAGPRS